MVATDSEDFPYTSRGMFTSQTKREKEREKGEERKRKLKSEKKNRRKNNVRKGRFFALKVNEKNAF